MKSDAAPRPPDAQAPGIEADRALTDTDRALPDTDRALADALRRFPQSISEAGVWSSIEPRVSRARRRRTALRLATAAVALVGLVAGWQAVRAYDWDRTAGVTPVTHPAAPEATATTTPAGRSDAGVSLLPPDSTDPRVDAVRRWTTALGAGDIEAAWALLDQRSKAAIGSAANLAAMSVDLGHNWARGTVGGYQLTDGRPIADRDVAVVTVFGVLSHGPSSMPFVVVTGPGGEQAILLHGLVPAAGDTSDFEWFRLISPERDGAVLEADENLTFVVPTWQILEGTDWQENLSQPVERIPGPLVLAVDDRLVGPGEWREAASGASIGTWPLTGIYDPPWLPPGDHVVTVVQFRDDGEVSASSAVFTVASPFVDAPVLPRSAEGGTPYDAQFGPGDHQREQAVEDYLRAVASDDVRAFAAALSPLDQEAAPALFADERARYERVGAEGYTVGAIRFNWWQDGGWHEDWGPTPPSVSTLEPLAQWLQSRAPARQLALVTTADGAERLLALEISDGVKVCAPGSGGLKGMDILGHSPATVMEAYLVAKQGADERAAYALLADPPIALDAYLQEMADAGEVLLSYDVGAWRLDGPDRASVQVSFKSQSAADGHVAEGVREEWRVERVDGLWKVGWLPRQ